MNKLKVWTRWGDYYSAPAFFDADLEYFACRNTCGVFDLSSMVKHRITGPDALEYMNRLVTRDVTKMGGLLKVIPFISVMYVIAGLASLGLPGFSGFMAEMQIFVGAFQHPDMFHRVATIITISAIVITAVYVLRVVGIMLMGPVKNIEFNTLEKATWYERTGVILLLIPIVCMGVFPIWLRN